MELKRKHKDQRSQTDRSRRQKPKDSFEALYESIMMMVDRLQVPFSADKLLEILKRNGHSIYFGSRPEYRPQTSVC